MEILTKSLGIEASKTVCSPGVKDYTEVDQLGEVLDDDLVMMARLSADVGMSDRKRIYKFCDEPEVIEVVPYGEIYGSALSSFVFTKSGYRKPVTQDAHRFTGKSANVMQARI